jgi:plastocyanin
VTPGTTVLWTNYGQHSHTVTASDGAWDSRALNQRGSYSYTFSRPGTYTYYCRVHPKEMRGTVVVGSGEGSGHGGAKEK